MASFAPPVLPPVLAALASTACAATSAPSVPSGADPGLDRPPSLVVVLADDLGWGDLGCQGQGLIETPHLDAMAAEGMRFEAGYAGSTVCAPSR